MLPWVKKFLRRDSTARPAMGGLVLRPLHERDLKTADS
jgi:hypothetical protein